MAVGIHILVILEQLFLKWWPVLTRLLGLWEAGPGGANGLLGSGQGGLSPDLASRPLSA